MKRLILVMSIGVFLWCPLLRAEEIPLTLDEAVALSLRENREVQLKAEEVKKAKLKIAQAQASLFPSLTFTGGWQYTRGYANKDAGQTTTQTGLRQTLYQGGKIINTVKYTEYGLEAAQAVLDKTKLETAFKVKKAFYALLLTQEFTRVNQGILTNAQAHLDSLKARYASGQASESDMLKVESALSSVKQVYDASLNQVEASHALLHNLLFLGKDVTVRPAGEFACSPQEVAYDEAFLKAMQSRPEIKQAEAQGKAAARAVEIARAEGRPTISASWDYYTRSHLAGLSGAPRNWNDYSALGLTFSWPVFDGWATKAKVEQALVDLKQAQLTKDKVGRDIALELKDSYLALKDAIGKMKATGAERAEYRDSLSVAQQKQRQGNVSSLDVDDAELKYAISEFNYKQTVYDYIVAKAGFDKATGGI